VLSEGIVDHQIAASRKVVVRYLLCEWMTMVVVAGCKETRKSSVLFLKSIHVKNSSLHADKIRKHLKNATDVPSKTIYGKRRKIKLVSRGHVINDALELGAKTPRGNDNQNSHKTLELPLRATRMNESVFCFDFVHVL
jgi:hypothetical protein